MSALVRFSCMDGTASALRNDKRWVEKRSPAPKVRPE